MMEKDRKTSVAEEDLKISLSYWRKSKFGVSYKKNPGILHKILVYWLRVDLKIGMGMFFGERKPMMMSEFRNF